MSGKNNAPGSIARGVRVFYLDHCTFRGGFTPLPADPAIAR